jgi:hypothetical protein
MDELIYLILIIGMVTVIGHGIWVLLAAILRAYSGESKETSASPSRCVECGTGLRAGDDFCHACGRWQRVQSNPGVMAELTIAARQLDRLLNQGKLDVETHKRVMQIIEAERESFTAPLRRDAVTTPPAIEPQPAVVEPLQPRDQVEPVIVQTPPAVVEQNVFAASQGEDESAKIHSEPVYAAASTPDVSIQNQHQPRRSFTEMLETFMEESSIRWGELVGGLLIIGCSIALVVSLWSEIASRPFLKFSVFIGMTSILFGLGFYSAHRWRLPTTSRGVLIISTLLVPLNFLAMTAFSHEAVPTSLLVVAGELLSLSLFLFLVYYAAQVFAPRSAWVMVLATLGPSFAMLMARHSTEAQSGWIRMSLLGIVPLVCYWVSSGAMLNNFVKRDAAEETDGEEHADQALIELGIASFATLLPLGLLFVRPGYLSQTLRQYAPLISLFGVPAIATGIVMLRGSGVTQSGKAQTAATSVGIVGSLISLAALLFAWPNPTGVVITALINSLVCAAVAVGSSGRIWRYDIRLAHIGAIVHLTLAFLIVANLLSRDLIVWVEDGSRLATSLVSRTSGAALLLLFALFAVISEFCLRIERRVESGIYAIGAVAIGLFSILLVTAHSFGRAGDPHHAWLIYAFYAAAAFVIAWRRQVIIFGWVANALMLLALVQLLAFWLSGTFPQPVRLSLQVFASVTTLLAIIASLKSEQLRRLFGESFTSSALISSFAVAPFILFGGWITNVQISMRMLWLAAIWLAIACLMRRPLLFAVFQIALTLCVVFGVAALFGHQWPQSFLSDLSVMQAQAVALALLSLAWTASRLFLRRFGTTPETAQSQGDESLVSARFFNPAVASGLLYPNWITIDRIVSLLLIGFLVWLSVLGAHVGMIEGLFPGQALSETGRMKAVTALGTGSWSLLLALALVLIVGLWERFEKRAVLALTLLLVCACLLVAGRWHSEGMTVATYRWLAAFSFALISSLIVFRDRVIRLCKQFEWPQFDERSNGLAAMLRSLTLILFVAPVLVATLIVFFNATSAPSASHPLGARFEIISLLIGPVLLIGLSFVAQAARERFPAYASAAGLMGNLAVTMAYLLATHLSAAAIGRAEIYRVAQLNIIATSLFSLVWIACCRRWAWNQSAGFLKTQIGMALYSMLSLLAVADVRLFFEPAVNSVLANSFGGGIGLLTAALPIIAFAQFRELKLDRLRAGHLGIGLLVAASLVACFFSRLEGNDWIAYRSLMLAFNAAAWLMLALRWIAARAAQGEPRDSLAHSTTAIVHLGAQSSIEKWIAALACAIALMVLRGMSSPGEPWWTAVFSLSICLLYAGLSVTSREYGYIFLANAALNLAVTRLYAWAIERVFFFGVGRPEDKVAGLVAVNTIAIALPAIAWLMLDLRVLRRTSAESDRNQITPFHRVAAPISLGLMSLVLLFLWLVKIPGAEQSFSIGVYGFLNWLALASVIAFLAACLWDDKPAYALRGLYLAGLLTIGMTFARLDWSLDETFVGVAVALSLYVMATGVLWHKRESLIKWAGELHMPSAVNQSVEIHPFLINANTAIGIIAFALAFGLIFNVESLALRLTAATAVFAIPISVALLAAGPRKQRLITVCVRLSLLSLVLWGWAWLSPAGGARVIDHLVILMIITEVVVIGYRFVVSRSLAKDDEWRQGVRAELPWIAVTGLASLAVVISIEASNYAQHGNAMSSWPVVIAVLATLILLSSASIAFALLPGKDPFNQDERGRMRYVYGAELLIVLTLLHLRLTMPWLFGQFFRAWWPLILMLLAFTGVGLSELFRRQGKQVLAEPLERTGILLPLLPVFGFSITDTEVSYSGLLFLVGLFYGVFSVTHRSFKFGMIAALAANSGWWNYLSGVDGYRLYEHPQLWLIPVSLSVLVAARINRDQLTPDQMTMVRYSTLIMIYVSSTADIFINGVRESPWLTMVLAVLSVAGVIAGLMLRVRAFLFLGTAFLLLSVLTMIWTASVNLGWEWLWYVTGIAFGVLIICTFALFERKRNEMLGLVERLKQWQA